MGVFTNDKKLSKGVLIYNLIASVCILFLIIQYFNNRKQIAYIDSTRVYNGYKGITLAKAEFEKKVESYKSRTDTLNARIKLSILNIEKVKNDKVKQNSFIDSVRFYKKQLNDYQLAMNESLKQEESKLTQKAMIKFNDFLKEYGEANGYEMILIANPSGTIAYAKDKYDITDKILKEANEKL